MTSLVGDVMQIWPETSSSWVDPLEKGYLWKDVGIYHAIKMSCLSLAKYPGLLQAAALFWSPTLLLVRDGFLDLLSVG